ncbi:hypothetical protein BB558_001882 [Smittium angustum]|uniref:CCAAT-binding factor domain-containing protein n=1 Tax=Smittium angustum TaxID=133377 RepID=A0A2U1JAC4_SMIAN|nr:hypothetical protein BB558_001882 [Smittium angustum]
MTASIKATKGKDKKIPNKSKANSSLKGKKSQESDDIEALELKSSNDNEESSLDLQKSLKEFADSIGLNTKDSNPTDIKLKKPKNKKAALNTPEDKKNSGIDKNLKKEKTPTTKKPRDINKEVGQIVKSEGTKIVFDDNLQGTVVESSKDNTPFDKKSRLTVDPLPQWYNYQLPEPNASMSMGDKEDIEALRSREKYAQELLDRENQLYDIRKRRGKEASMTTNDVDFVSSILKTGTLSDKISALTLMVQESPIHNISSLTALMNMARKKHRREAIMAVSSIKDLLVNNLLPDRKLVYFADRPWKSTNLEPKHWIMWMFEDHLKKTYFELMKIIEEMLYDTVEHTKLSMLIHVESLLESKPEQEQNLLRLLIMKLGDKDKKVSSKASFLALTLLNAHPNMKMVVIKTMQELLLSRIKNGNERAQYYSMITLNQVILTSKDTEAANLLIDVYLTYFQTIAVNNDKFGEVDDTEDKKNKKPRRKIQKAYYGRNAMVKSKEKAENEQESAVKSLENRLLAAILTGLNRALPFSNMPKEAWEKHTDVLFRVSHSANFNVVIQTLLFLFQITQHGANDGQRFYRALYESLLDPRIESSSKQSLYLNLIFKSLNVDKNIERIQAFVKRMLQISMHHSIPFVCGILYIISDLANTKPKIRALWKTAPPLDNVDLESSLDKKGDEESNTEKVVATLGLDNGYDPNKREPMYAKAEKSRCWELTLLLKHYHPSIALQVAKILNGDKLERASNLHIHSLNHFLDRFVYRKPKQDPKMKGVSIMQPDYSNKNNSENVIGSTQIVWAKDSNLILNKNVSRIDKKLLEKLNQGMNVDGENINDMLENETQGKESDESTIKTEGQVEQKQVGRSRRLIPNYLVQSGNQIQPENIFFQRFMSMKSTKDKKKKDRKMLDDENFDNIDDSKNDGDLGNISSDDEDVASDLDPSFLGDDDTGFSSAMLLAEPNGKKSKKKKASKFDDGNDSLDEDEVWKAISSNIPDLENEEEDDDDDDIGFNEDDFNSSEFGSDLDEEDGTKIDGEDDGDNGEFGSDDYSSDADSMDDLDMVFAENHENDTKKRSSKSVDDKKKGRPAKKQKREKLPMFASFDDYAALIDG